MLTYAHTSAAARIAVGFTTALLLISCTAEPSAGTGTSSFEEADAKPGRGASVWIEKRCEQGPCGGFMGMVTTLPRSLFAPLRRPKTMILTFGHSLREALHSRDVVRLDVCLRDLSVPPNSASSERRVPIACDGARVEYDKGSLLLEAEYDPQSGLAAFDMSLGTPVAFSANGSLPAAAVLRGTRLPREDPQHLFTDESVIRETLNDASTEGDLAFRSEPAWVFNRTQSGARETRAWHLAANARDVEITNSQLVFVRRVTITTDPAIDVPGLANAGAGLYRPEFVEEVNGTEEPPETAPNPNGGVGRGSFLKLPCFTPASRRPDTAVVYGIRHRSRFVRLASIEWVVLTDLSQRIPSSAPPLAGADEEAPPVTPEQTLEAAREYMDRLYREDPALVSYAQTYIYREVLGAPGDSPFSVPRERVPEPGFFAEHDYLEVVTFSRTDDPSTWAWLQRLF